LDLGRVYHGLQLQLFAYMAAAMELQKANSPQALPVPAAMLYYRMEEPELDWKEESEAGREERMLNALKCSGYVSDNLEVLAQMDRHFMGEGGRSLLFPVGFKKDGSFDSHSHILSDEQFERLMQHTKEKMTEIGNRIYQGEIGAVPYHMQNESGCDYCAFSDICGVEKKDSQSCARELPKMTEEEVWEVLYGKNNMDE
jgi:ATP-dependent helicase/nuclease subunit B